MPAWGLNTWAAFVGTQEDAAIAATSLCSKRSHAGAEGAAQERPLEVVRHSCIT